MAKTLPGARRHGWALVGFLISAFLHVSPLAAAGDPGTVSFSEPFYAVMADAGVVLISINRIGGSAGSANAGYVTIESSAIAGTDFSTTHGSVNWTDGDIAPKTFMVPISPTGAGSVAFSVTLISASGANFGAQTSATVYIYPAASSVATGAAPGNIEFSQPNYSVAPDSSSVTATLNRVGGSTGTASASLTTLDGSAGAGVAYAQTRATVNWDDGDSTPKTLTIPLIPHSAPGRTFTLALTSASGAAFGTNIDASVSIRQTGAGSVALYWAAPTQNTDGGPITDLAGYDIYYFGNDPTQPTRSLRITDPSASSVQLGGLSSGTWYFAAAAYNSLGVSSDLSATVATTIQ